MLDSLSSPRIFPQFYGSSEAQFVSRALVLFVGARRRIVENVKWNPLITSQAIRDNCEGRARKTQREEEQASRKREVSKGKQNKSRFVVWGFLRTIAFAFNFLTHWFSCAGRRESETLKYVHKVGCWDCSVSATVRVHSTWHVICEWLVKSACARSKATIKMSPALNDVLCDNQSPKIMMNRTLNQNSLSLWHFPVYRM